MPEWLPIPGCTGYEISDQGFVRNKHGRLLTRFPASYGGGLFVNIGKSTRLIHKLVLLVFIGPSNEQIYWRNGNKQDNRLANLCYGKPVEPMRNVRCRNGHEMLGNNVRMEHGSRVCTACERGEPPVMELPEVL